MGRIIANFLLILLAIMVENNEVMGQSPEWSKVANIYEVNIRQYTPEGTINAFSKHLDRLSEMGVKILWLMPIHPIGEKNRKGILGSPYSIRNFKAVNPDMGTIEDFKSLVVQAHNRGMYVIMDWVTNHSAWDCNLITEQPDWYSKDDKGNIISPNNEWTDVADFNYKNKDLRAYMIGAMNYWVKECNIDGFRCDVAEMVPDDFWKEAIQAVNNEKANLFWLAEAETPRLHKLGFNASYGWNVHHTLHDIVTGKKSVSDLEQVLMDNVNNYDPTAYRMLFTSNHDENSWNGTEYEKFSEAALSLAVLSAVLPDMLLIYSGQEAMNDRRLSFFDRDVIQWGNIPLNPFYGFLNELKKNNPVLWNGAYGGDFKILKNDQSSKTLSFVRTKGDDQMIAVFNLSNQPRVINVSGDFKGEFINVFSNENHSLDKAYKLTLKEWEYVLLQKK